MRFRVRLLVDVEPDQGAPWTYGRAGQAKDLEELPEMIEQLKEIVILHVKGGLRGPGKEGS